MKKKIYSVVLVAAMVLSLGACGSKEKPAEKEEPKDNGGKAAEEVTIGYSYPTTNNEFWGNALTYIEQAGDELGFKIVADDCNNDQSEQVNDVDSMISSGIDALVLAPQDASVCAGIAASCKSNEIPLVIVDRWPGDDLKVGEDYICFIGPDDEEAGYQMAMSLINGGSKKLVGLGGYQGTSVAEDRKKGLDKALEENPDVELLQFEYAGENWDEGDTTFRNLYQSHPDLDGVWSYNDSLALASVNVLKEEGKIANVKVGGMDLLNPAIESMQNNELWFSTGGHYLQSAFGAVVAYDAANGMEYDGEPKVKLELLAVSQENLGEFEEKFMGEESPIKWTELSKVTNPDATYDFKISLE